MYTYFLAGFPEGLCVCLQIRDNRDVRKQREPTGSHISRGTVHTLRAAHDPLSLPLLSHLPPTRNGNGLIALELFRPRIRPHLQNQLLRTTHNPGDGPISRSPHKMVMLVNPLGTDPMLTVDDNHESKEGDGYRGEGGGSGYHEHDDHLQPGGLLDGRTSEDGTGHHSGDGDYSKDAVRVGEGYLDRVSRTQYAMWMK